MSHNQNIRNNFAKARAKNQTPAPKVQSQSSKQNPLMPYEEVDIDGVVAGRFKLLTRTGKQWSYPYYYISLIDLPTPESMTVFCNCKHVEVITIQGLGLDRLAYLLDQHRLTLIRESNHPNFQVAPITVREILVQMAKP